MEEVVAKKANLLVPYIIVIVMGLGMIAFGAYMKLAMDNSGALIVGLIVGCVLAFFGVIMLVIYFRTPKVFITYKDGKLHLADGTECYPFEVTDVLIKITRTNGIESSTGGIVLTVHGRKIEYKNVKKIRDVQTRLGELYNISRDAYFAALEEEEREKAEKPAENSEDSAEHNVV